MVSMGLFLIFVHQKGAMHRAMQMPAVDLFGAGNVAGAVLASEALVLASEMKRNNYSTLFRFAVQARI